MLAPAAALLAALPAMAQTVTVSGACVRDCGAVSRVVRENRPELQACLIRCRAAQDYARGAARALPQDAYHAPAARAALPAAPASSAAKSAASSLPGGHAVPAPAGLPPVASSAPFAPSPPPVAAGTRYGAAYVASAPGVGVGLAIGLADRIAAHGQAQRDCLARGVPCREVLEFTDRCGAVAQARRTLGMFRSDDPTTYSVAIATAGAGPTRQAAEAAAMADCRMREPRGGCQVAVSACGDS